MIEDCLEKCLLSSFFLSIMINKRLQMIKYLPTKNKILIEKISPLNKRLYKYEKI